MNLYFDFKHEQAVEEGGITKKEETSNEVEEVKITRNQKKKDDQEMQIGNVEKEE